MSIPDRKAAPAINVIKKANVLQATKDRLRNGIPVYYINSGTQNLSRIELIFPAGLWQQTGPLVASSSSAMLQEGTSKYSSKVLAEAIDHYGAFLNTATTYDFATIEIHVLNKHLERILPLSEEIISNSVFPENEWKIHLENKKQNFIINNKKVSLVARKKFAELLFGNNHPYGYNLDETDFDKIQKADAYNFYKNSYCVEDTVIIASGKITDSVLKLLETYFSHLPNKSATAVSELKEHTTVSKNKESHFINKPDALQSAIRIGKLLFTKSHPDYPAMQVVNTILGGYFGSRLMTNIREDKGYTYGIGSSLISLTHGGYFTIATEVGVEVTNNTLKEIYHEINRLQTEKVSVDELELVRNYMLGSFLRSIDGPFALADRFKGIYFSGMDYNYFNRLIETIQTITPEKIMQLATTYLQKEDMIELVVGKK